MKKTNSYKWAYLPVLFTSVAVLSTQLVAGEYQAQEARQVNSIGHQYVGGNTRVGVSVTDDGDASADLSHIFSETQNSSTSGGLWAGFDLDGDDKGVDSGGVQINHNWVSRDGRGNATHVNKAFAAYDRNDTDDAKVTVGYGQERAAGFWEGHVSKGLSDKRLAIPATGSTKAVYEKAYDWGVGASVGTFIPNTNTRVRAGIDHQWGDDVAADEENAAMTTLSAGIEQFFKGTPHSIGLDIAASRKKGGYEFDGSDDTETTANLSYHYDFGGANIYQPDQRYRRVRVEVPGKGRAATYAKKPVYKQQPIYKKQPVYKNQPIYKKQPIYTNKTVQVPTGNMAKSTVELEGQTFFKYGSAVLIPSAQQRLRQIANEIRKHGYKGNIRITGNSCGLGDPRRDQELSEERANAVRDFMISQGFNPAHLMARGLGKSHPKYPTTADQDFKNRRVDIEYVTERQVAGGTGYRTETRRVQNGFRNVIAGYKRIQTGTKNVQVGVRNVQTGTTDILVSQGAPGTPRVIWRTEAIPTAPAWIARALRSNFSHNRNVDTYLTTSSGSDADRSGGNTGPVATNDTTKISVNQTAQIDVLNNDFDSDGD
ncbi:OmpA family protein [Leucothrix pacifica]|nr:OmpA family protein [Leucothrix pacifica]